jgi:hypothetical protein
VNATIWLAGTITSIPESEMSNSLLINQLTYPDKTEFVVSSSEILKNAAFNVYDVVGNLVYKTSDINDVTLMNNEFGAGMYIYKVVADGAILKTGKFLVK